MPVRLEHANLAVRDLDAGIRPEDGDAR